MPSFIFSDSDGQPESSILREAPSWSDSARNASAAARRGGTSAINKLAKQPMGIGHDATSARAMVTARVRVKKTHAQRKGAIANREFQAKLAKHGGSWQEYWAKEGRPASDARYAARAARGTKRADNSLTSIVVPRGTYGRDVGSMFSKMQSAKYKGNNATLAKRFNKGVVAMNRYQFAQNSLTRRVQAGIASKSQIKRHAKLSRITTRYSKALRNIQAKIKT